MLNKVDPKPQVPSGPLHVLRSYRSTRTVPSSSLRLPASCVMTSSNSTAQRSSSWKSQRRKASLRGFPSGSEQVALHEEQVALLCLQ